MACLQTLDDFYEVSGLKLNDKKQKLFGLGPNVGAVKCQSLRGILSGQNTKLKFLKFAS